MAGEVAAVLCDPAGRRELRLGAENELTLRVTNGSRGDIVEPLLQLSLASLFATAVEQARVAVTVPAGWGASYSSRLAAWELRAPRGFVLGHGATVEARFARVRPAVPVGVPLLALVVSDAASVRRSTIAVQVLPGASAGAALWERVEAHLRSAGDAEACEIAISHRPDEPVRGDLVLTLLEGSGRPLIRKPWGPWPPTLTLVIPTAEHPPGHGALTTPRMLDDAEVTIERGRGWRVVKRRPGPEWDIVAVASGGRRHVLGADDELELRIRRLTTDFAEGEATVELRACGFPGYADDVRAFTVRKRYRAGGS